MGKSSGLVTHMTGFDSRIRIDSGCSAMAARRVRDPEEAGSIPATLTYSGTWRSSSKRLEQLAVYQKDAGSNPACAARYPTRTSPRLSGSNGSMVDGYDGRLSISKIGFESRSSYDKLG